MLNDDERRACVLYFSLFKNLLFKVRSGVQVLTEQDFRVILFPLLLYRGVSKELGYSVKNFLDGD